MLSRTTTDYHMRIGRNLPSEWSTNLKKYCGGNSAQFVVFQAKPGHFCVINRWESVIIKTSRSHSSLFPHPFGKVDK